MSQRQERTQKKETLACIVKPYYLWSPVLQYFPDRAPQITVAAVLSTVQ